MIVPTYRVIQLITRTPINNTTILQSLSNRVALCRHTRKPHGTRHLSNISPGPVFRAITESKPSEITGNFLTAFHDYTGLPWWCVIVASSALIRSYALVWGIQQDAIEKRVNKVKEELDKFQNHHKNVVKKNAVRYMWTNERATKEFKLGFYIHRRELWKKYKVHPGRIMILQCADFPLFFFFSVVWRAMAYGFSDDVEVSQAIISQMMTEGPLWISNLTVPDELHILPILVFLTAFSSAKLLSLKNNLYHKNVKFSKMYSVLSHFLIMAIGVATNFLPSAVGLFWWSLSAFRGFIVLLIENRKFRRAFNLSYKPYDEKDLIAEYKKYLLNKVLRRN